MIVRRRIRIDITGSTPFSFKPEVRLLLIFSIDAYIDAISWIYIFNVTYVKLSVDSTACGRTIYFLMVNNIC